MSLTHVKSAIAGSVSLRFTFLRYSSIPSVGYRTLDVSTSLQLLLLLRCCSLYLEVKVGCGKLQL